MATPKRLTDDLLAVAAKLSAAGPKSGFFPLAWSMDSVGPLARRVEDVALLLDAISGWDASDPSAVPGAMAPALPTLRDGVKGLRIGVPEDYFWRPIQSEGSFAAFSLLT